MESHSRYYHIKECSMNKDDNPFNDGQDAFTVLMAIAFVGVVIALGEWYA